MNKICTKCNKVKPFNGFWRQKGQKHGLRPQCKICLSEKAKMYNESNKEFINLKRRLNNRKEFPLLKKKCRRDLGNAIRDGKIYKRNTCEMCYISPTECHQDNYNKPLEFMELCKACHSKLHLIYR